MAAAAPPAISLEKAPIADVFTDLHADMHQGLTSAEARARAGQYGPNAIEEKKKSQLSMFLAYFWGPMPWMIEAAAIMSLLVKDYVDFIIILALLLFNGGLGFWQEHQAANALDALKSALAEQAQVLRDGKWGAIAAKTLVPGSGRPEVVRRRLRGCRPVGTDGRIASRCQEGWGRGVFRVDHQEGRDERSGDRDWLEHVLWTHG
jgi:hypothetical protein